jgi:hypothetical protein
MEEYRREKLELWFRSKPEAAAEDPARQAVVLDIKRMLRRNPLMRPSKATQQTFERLASPREASEQMVRTTKSLKRKDSLEKNPRLDKESNDVTDSANAAKATCSKSLSV